MLLPLGLFAQQAGITIVGLSGQNMTITGSTLHIPAGGYLNATGNIFVATNQIVADSNNTVITGSVGSRKFDFFTSLYTACDAVPLFIVL